MLDRIVGTKIMISKQHTMLLGPRQTGKSTIARFLSPTLSINLADEALYLSYQRNPRLLKDQIGALPPDGLVVIDEVQRVPSLLNTLQVLMDEKIGHHRYLLTGSSARKLKKGGANLLPGRIVQEKLSPLLLPEFNDSFSLDRVLTLGCLPGIYLSESSEDLLESYANTYLREEIQAEGLVENIGGFARLLDVVAAVSGKWLNYSKLASDTEIPKETIRRYISVLEDTLILERLNPFQIGLKIDRRVRQKEKIFLFDVGVRNAILRLHRTQLPATLQGETFEQFIILQFIGLIRAYHLPWKVSSFLGANDQEVDLVIETPEKILGIEIKRGHQLHERRFAGLGLLEEICKEYKPVKKYVLYTGESRLKIEEGVVVLPYREAFTEIFS